MMSTPTNMAKRPPMRPRLAATLLVIDHAGDSPRVLMGRRSDAHVFMPGFHVFPGGAVERADYRGAAVLDDVQAQAVLRALPLRAGHNTANAIARAALREMTEETGFTAHTDTVPTLHYLGRAITPPGQVRRYDTRFFIASRRDFSAAQSTPDNELLQLEWVDLELHDSLKIHHVTAFMAQQAKLFVRGQIAQMRPCLHTRHGQRHVRDE